MNHEVESYEGELRKLRKEVVLKDYLIYESMRALENSMVYLKEHEKESVENTVKLIRENLKDVFCKFEKYNSIDKYLFEKYN